MITIIANTLLHSCLTEHSVEGDDVEAYKFVVPVEGTTTIIGDTNRHPFIPYIHANEDVLVFDTLEHFTMYCAVKGNPDMNRVWLEDEEGNHVVPPYTDAHSLKLNMRTLGLYPNHKILLRLDYQLLPKNKEVL